MAADCPPASTRPALYDLSRDERDACGIGFVADAAGRPSREIVELALRGLERLRHRGAIAADARTGDGAGLLLPIPAMLAPRDGGHGIAMAFLPPSAADATCARTAVEDALAAEGLEHLGWREVPVDPSALGEHARTTRPGIEQALFRFHGDDTAEAERRCFRAGRRAERAADAAGVALYLASISTRTVTYKALCAADQLAAFYPDLADAAFTAPFAVFHQRYSTNTLPSWERAQPFRFLCHNGEINTLAGNEAAMRARESDLGAGELAPPGLLAPLLDPAGSDSAKLDNAVELLVRAGRDIRHTLTMLVPAAYPAGAVDPAAAAVRDFARYHEGLTEPWDGPAGLVFTDGVTVGATLDRNGLRPMRWEACADGLVVCASEAGAVDTTGRGEVRRGRLGPGQMLCVDPEAGGLLLDDEIKATLAAARPYGAWLAERLRPASTGKPVEVPAADSTVAQVAHGFTRELVSSVLRPMATTGKEPTASMGDDTPPALLGRTIRPVGHYLRQRFAQVTNPPIDHLRERHVMSTRTLLGRRAPLCSDGPEAAELVELRSFLLTPDGLAAVTGPEAGLDAVTLDASWPVGEGPAGLQTACLRLGAEAEGAVRAGAQLVVLDDAAGEGRVPVPALLAVGAVRAALVGAGLATRAGIVAATDEPVDPHSAATLLGYGAEAICPRLSLQVVAGLTADDPDIGPEAGQERYLHALEEGVLKVMSRMGISVLAAYKGAAIFEAVGLSAEVIETCFPGTPSPVGGAGFAELGADALARVEAAGAARPKLDHPGWFKFRPRAEYHQTNPEVMQALHFTVRDDEEMKGSKRGAHLLRSAVTGGGFERYEHFASLVNGREPAALRDLVEPVPAGAPIPLDEVEPAAAILARFSTSAMSHGALSSEAHETLAAAMHLIGGKANSGEGGEAPERYGTERNSAIKQLASGRFGVTPAYIASADELQIKMAQGSKPGEGGQIPGHKVTDEIARLRHTQPGVGLISPPPHHDIYSIEDLAELVYDLKQANPAADVSVKLVAEAGVGTVAAGVVKALADVVQISGADGGTGASPLSSIKHAGGPWELGLAETQQALVANGLRGRVRVRVDGGFKTGRDVLVAALLGADEYGFGTATLLAEGCLMVRTCHQNNCPVGIATQRPDLRAKFAGTPEQVAGYLRFVAEETRRLLAGLGLRSLGDAVGRVELLRRRPAGEGSRDGLLDLGPMLAGAGAGAGPVAFEAADPFQRPRSELGDRIAADTLPGLRRGEVVHLQYGIGNTDRAVGARLGVALGADCGDSAPPGRARLDFTGVAGQSFGAFLAAGVELRLTGAANDYVGKGLGGGRIVIGAPDNDAGDPVLAGNTVLYGATAGELFIAGRAGERFAVRNSGATAVVEGVGDHACEYMTGGTVVVLGPAGRNLAAGMSGGELWLHDPEGGATAHVNGELVEAVRADPVRLAGLRELITRHAELTGSAVATRLLADWERAAEGFWRIAPSDEVAVIEEAKQA